MTKYYTYAHYTADTNELFYIGKGARNRVKQICNRNTWWHNKVNKHGGFVHKILAWWPTESEALDHEKFLIDCFEEMGTTLVNIQKARGKEVDGFKQTKEHRQKRSELSKAWWSSLTKEERKEFGKCLSKSLKGVLKTEEHKQNLSKARTGMKVPITWKPVKCLTTGIIYPSLTEAALKNNCDPSHVAKCCRGKLKKTNNLEFAYG